MKISGIQKLSLLDYPEKMACTLFTWGCNFRCPFCHNASLVTDKEYDVEESEDGILSFLKKRQGILDGICITGGEPLLQPGIEEFMEKIKKLGFLIKLDTNGSFPEILKKVVEDKVVDYVAMDIKNSKEKYPLTIDIREYDMSNVEKSVDFLMSSKVDHEFRTTVVKEFHEEKDFEDIGKWIKGADKYYLQAFVDSGNLIKDGLHGYSKEDMQKFKDIMTKFVKFAEIRGL